MKQISASNTVTPENHEFAKELGFTLPALGGEPRSPLLEIIKSHKKGDAKLYKDVEKIKKEPY
jgi:hypothetical protein